MKRVISSSIRKSTPINCSLRKYTADDIVQLLSRIDELKDFNTRVSETNDGKASFTVGNSMYKIDEKKPMS